VGGVSGFTWRWPLALLVGALIVAAVVVLVIRATTRKKLREDTLDTRAQEPNDANEASAADQNAPEKSVVWTVRSFFQLEPIGSAYRSYRIASIAALSLVCGALLVSLGLVARPSTVNENSTSSSSRDIVLCLDVSGSSLPFDREVIATYLELVKSFKTERIGMSIFNSTSRTVFPLTDDYDLVTTQLTSAMKALKGVQTQDDIDAMSDAQYQAISDWLAGTQNRKDATSLIGDGLVNCAAMIPGFSATGGDAQSGSPASIVFASDNVLSGSPLYSLQEALDVAKKNSIHVDALFTGAQESEGDATTVDMKERVEADGGTFMTRSQENSVADLVRSIESEKSKQAEHDSTTDVIDSPTVWVGAVALLMGAFFIVTGWVRR
jgi:hypothetical protein